MGPSLATHTRAGLAGLLDFVRPRHRAILLTRRAGGSPQGSPLTSGVDDAGRRVMSTCPERAKTVNARRDPSVSVIVLSDEWNGPWAQVDGEAEVIDAPESVEPLVDYFRNIPGELRTGTSTGRPCGSRGSPWSGSLRSAGGRSRRVVSRPASPGEPRPVRDGSGPFALRPGRNGARIGIPRTCGTFRLTPLPGPVSRPGRLTGVAARGVDDTLSSTLSSTTSAREQPVRDEEWSAPLPDPPLLHLPGFEDDEDPAEPHICRGID